VIECLLSAAFLIAEVSKILGYLFHDKKYVLLLTKKKDWAAYICRYCAIFAQPRPVTLFINGTNCAVIHKCVGFGLLGQVITCKKCPVKHEAFRIGIGHLVATGWNKKTRKNQVNLFLQRSRI
jgi:hypothetical protein